MKLRKRNRETNMELEQWKESTGLKMFESSFPNAVSLESSWDDVAVDLKYLKSLELRYGVEIPHHAVQAASQILLTSQSLQKVGGLAPLLEETASKLRNDFNSNLGEEDLDRYFFLFNRALVESSEIIKEKDLEVKEELEEVNQELEELKCALEAFRKHWSAPLEHHISVARRSYLDTLCEGIAGILSQLETCRNLDLVATAIRDLHGTLSGLLHTLDISFTRRLTVTSRIIAEVASSMFPRIFFPAPFQFPPKLLMQRLSRRLISLDNQLLSIINAMSIQKRGSPHMYSFLLLGPPGQGKTTLAEALAEEMFDDRIAKYDVADLNGQDFVKQVCACPLFVIDGAQLTSGVSETLHISSCVIVFENIEKANAAVFHILYQILQTGSYVDVVGRRIAFSNILIIFTSTVILPRCACQDVFSESSFNPPFKGLLKGIRETQKPDCGCKFPKLLMEVEMWFQPGFFDSLDDVIVLPWLSRSQYMVMFRMQVRNAASLCKKKVVVYPSPAVFRNFWQNNVGKILEEGGHAIKRFVEDDLISALCNVEGMSAVYIDLLLGSNELSFRTQKLSNVAVVHDCKTFIDSLRNSKIFYQIEKEQATMIYDLSIAYFGLVELLDSKDEGNCPGVLSGVREMLAVFARPKDNHSREQVAPEGFNHGVDIVHERGKRAKYTSEVEFSKLASRLVEQVPPVQVIANAFLKSIDAYQGHCMDDPRQQATSFLVLGLRSMGKCLVDSLSEYFVADDGTPMLVEVDLSACTYPNASFSCTCRDELKKAILMRPYSVIVFYNLESAHQPAFTNIISILDDGLLFDNDGSVLDFRKSVIVVVSQLGNKRIISKAVGGPNGSDNWDGISKGPPVGFRFEMLNRVDEILLFNPLSSEQLLQGARLSMKEGQLLVGTHPGIVKVLLYLFSDDERPLGGERSKVRGVRSKLDPEFLNACMFALRKGLIKFDGSNTTKKAPVSLV